jgi:hypothetical protein
MSVQRGRLRSLILDNSLLSRCAAVGGLSHKISQEEGDQEADYSRLKETRAGGPRYARASETLIQKNKHLVSRWCLFFWISVSLYRRPQRPAPSQP